MYNHKNISQSIKKSIIQADKILIVSHRRPDGDTLGANLALAIYLKKLGKEVTSFCVDSLPQSLAFLPNSHLLTNDHLIFREKYDLIIVVDSSNYELTAIKELLNALPTKYTLINIDHHVSNPQYGNINLVLTDSSSTCEIIYRLLKDWSIVWDKDIASNLACGIITDTGGLKNAATSYHAIAAVADLIAKGANIHKIINLSLNKPRLSQLKLWGRALERLNKSDKYNLVYTWLGHQDYQECEATEADSEGLSNFLHILKEAEIIMVLRESDNNMIRGSLRTSSDVDLTKLAGLFGGGGHKKAAGFDLPGKLVYDNNELRIV